MALAKIQKRKNEKPSSVGEILGVSGPAGLYCWFWAVCTS